MGIVIGEEQQHAEAESNYLDKVILSETYRNEEFFKGCKWSADDAANRILTCVGNSSLKVFHTFLNKSNFQHSHISNEFYELKNVGKIYDFDWFPTISSSQYYAITASSLGPVHVWDLTTSKCEASYRMYNIKDEAIHAHCVTCSADGQQIYAATADYIFLFNAEYPGRTYQHILTRSHFRKAIISAITVNPIRSSMFAVGSYNSRIGIYDDSHLLCLLFGHHKGITHLRFSPNGTYLYSGTRGHGDIICWDLRNPGTALYKMQRKVNTQQRIYFEISHHGKHVISGNTNGDVHIWDTALPPVDDILLPLYTFRAHSDCTNGVSINRHVPVLATVSGQYHGNEMCYLLEDGSDENGVNHFMEKPSIENSLKLWHFKL